MTKAAIVARDDHKADWILHNDADEFWFNPEGALTKSLDETSADILLCQRLNMLCPREEVSRGPWIRQCVYRVAVPFETSVPDDPLSDPLPCPYFYRRLPPKVLTRTDGLVEVRQGNHDVRFSRDTVEAPSPIRIFHYPIRSIDQLRSKIENGGRSYERNEKLPIRAGWHWRRWYRMLQTEDIGAILADALPSLQAATRDLADGTLVEDRRMLAMLDTLKA